MDHLLPFRELAPTRIKARTTVYNGLGKDITPERFWSILSHRGVFYGSVFAQEHGGHFASLEDWEMYRNGEGADKPQTYFVNSSAYGPSNKHRVIDLVPRYWSLRNKWMNFSKNQFTGFMSLFSFLSSKDELEIVVGMGDNINGLKTMHRKRQGKRSSKHRPPNFPNIGPLAALLISGDLAIEGIVPKPTVEEMGRIVFKLGKGALVGLIRLGLVEKKSVEQEVVSAFSFLYNYLERNLTTEVKTLISFDVFMLEHGLCKYSRVVKT